MTRTITFATLALLTVGPLAATDAEAIFIRKTSASARAADNSANTLGLRADQLRIGSKRWFEQMEREGRLGGPRG